METQHYHKKIIIYPGLRLPKDLTVAFSGGADSVAAATFLARRHNVNLVFVHHQTKEDDQAEAFVREFVTQYNFRLKVFKVPAGTPAKEHNWRVERYKILHSLPEIVVTAHHLNDCVETWIWSAMNGIPRLIQRNFGNVVRPFLVTPKSKLVDWCVERGLDWFECPSNSNLKFTRNYIRNEVIAHAYRINPGLDSMVRRRLLQRFEFERAHLD